MPRPSRGLLALLLGGTQVFPALPMTFLCVAVADCDGTHVAWEWAASVHLILQTRLPSFLCAASCPC